MRTIIADSRAEYKLGCAAVGYFLVCRAAPPPLGRKPAGAGWLRLRAAATAIRQLTRSADDGTGASGGAPPVVLPEEPQNADQQPPSGNSRVARGLSQRSDDDRGRGADLPDDELSVPQHRARRKPVRPRRTRQHLHPD